MIAGLKAESAQRIGEARQEGPFDSVEDFARRAGLEPHEIKQLAAADVLMSLPGRAATAAGVGGVGMEEDA